MPNIDTPYERKIKSNVQNIAGKKANSAAIDVMIDLYLFGIQNTSAVKNNDISHKKHKFQNPYFNVFKPNTKIQFIVTKYSSIN